MWPACFVFLCLFCSSRRGLLAQTNYTDDSARKQQLATAIMIDAASEFAMPLQSRLDRHVHGARGVACLTAASVDLVHTAAGLSRPLTATLLSILTVICALAIISMCFKRQFSR